MMLRFNFLPFLICIFGGCLLIDGYEQQQWIRVVNETACGDCPLDHQCFRPLNFEPGPFICHPDRLNINLPLIKSVEHYCSSLNTQWLIISYVTGICAIFTIVNILLVICIVRCRACR